MKFTTHFSARDGGYFCKVYTACGNVALTTDYHPTASAAERFARSYIAWEAEQDRAERCRVEGMLAGLLGE